jgi:hypothetical protein
VNQICYEDKGQGKKRWGRINRIIILSCCQGREHYRPSLAVDKKATKSRYEISKRVGATTNGTYNSQTNTVNAASRFQQLQATDLTIMVIMLCLRGTR